MPETPGPTPGPSFASDVRRAVEDQPYEVVDGDEPGRFDVRLDVVDARWWGLLRRSGLQKSWTWQVRERPDGTYSVTDRPASLSWSGGLDGGRPTLRVSASFKAGTFVEVGRRTTWALGDDGRMGPVVDYRFDSCEGRDVIDAVAARRGLRKTMNTAAKIGLWTAIGAVGSIVVLGLVVLVLALTGHLG